VPTIPVVTGNANYVVPLAGLKAELIDLAILNPSDMPVGTPVVSTAGDTWILTVATTAVDHTTVESVSGCPGLRWVKGTGGGGGGGGSSNATTPVDGAAITNADITIAPGTDRASRYTLPVATYAGNHVVTIGTAGSPPAGMIVEIVRRDLTGFTMTVANGGLAGGNLVVSAASPVTAASYFFQYDGANWIFINSMFAV
jgi:hypothetical protein